MEAFAVLIVMLGWGIKYWVNRRKFYRRNQVGKEGFNSYEKMRLTMFLEGLGWLIANLLIIGGILLFLFMWVSSQGSHK
jgi:hypothetical protein